MKVTMIRVLSLMIALPLTLAACSAAGAGATGTADTAGNPPSVPFETVLQTSLPGQAGTEKRELARDAVAWKALWDQLREGSNLPAEPPAVDFEREMVIAAAMETQGCVSKVTIRTVTQTADGLVVDLLEAPPAPNCRCITSERPFHIVKLAKHAGPVRFTAERGETSCGGGSTR
jgi:hypothetical protein